MSERGSEIVYRAENVPVRFFKACRWCRRQKMRCDARSQVPCFRCRSSGRDCILDPIEDGRRRNDRRRKTTTPARNQNTASPLDPRTGYHTPASRDQGFSPATVQDGGFDTPIDSLPDSTGLSSLQRSYTSDANGPESQQLSPNEMIAPASAVHSMSVNLLDTNDIFMENSAKGDSRGDIVARGIVSEELARVMYERFTGGSKNFLPLFDPIRDTFDSVRSRSLFCFTVIIYLASRAVTDLRGDTHMQRVLQDEAQRLAEDSFFERPTKLETVQGMILLAAYSEKTWFSIALILRTALDSGLEKSLDTLLSQENVPRSSLSASMAERELVWKTRTWLITFILELDVASGTGRKSRIAEVDVVKLRKFLDYPLSLPFDMRTVCIIELHQLRGNSRVIIDNTSTIGDIVSTELPAIMTRLQTWWTTWDEIHERAFQRSSLKLMLHYARIFVFCASLARIQKLEPTYTDSSSEILDQDVMNLWQSLVTTIMDQLGFLINEPAYRCQLPWAPTYPALTIAFVTTFALRVARWRPNLINQSLLLERAERICDFLKQPPYPDIHRTVSIFVNYARALIASQRPQSNHSTDVPILPQSEGPPFEGTGNPMINGPPPSGVGPLDDLRYRTGPAIQGDKDPNMVSMPSSDPSAVARAPVSRLSGTMEAPNWTVSNSIADSFGLFEEGQNDIFDFLPMMPAMPQNEILNGSDSRHPFFSSDKRSLASTENNQNSNGEYQIVELSQNELLVEFQEDSPKNPPNWAFSKKFYNAVVGLFIVLNSGISSALPSNAVPAIMQDFHESGDQQKVLPTAVFLIGYVIGPLLFSPLSETIGRKPVLLWSFTVFVLATLGCALAPNWSSLLVFRTICGLAGAAPQTVVGGIYADLFFDLRSRGRAMAMYMSACSFGPILGPIISGCSVKYGWRWTFRIDLILTGVTWLALLFTSETFGPALLKRQSAKLRKDSGSNRYFSRQELNLDSRFTPMEIITRPIAMLFFEPIITSTSIYIALAYSLVFFYFQAYPIIFGGVYNFTVEQTSLTYIPIGVGAASSGFVALYYDIIYEKAKKLNKAWTSSPEYHRLPMCCIAGPCLTVSMFWLAWTAKSTVHWAAPVMSGFIFGYGFQTIFISLLTYVTDAYKIYSASALAASVILRSIAGALFPLAADPLYESFGVSWATSLLAFVSFACIPIPFALMRWGPWIRERSPFCQRLILEEKLRASGLNTPAHV
ncbi:MFS multidrug transporter [Penicillium mononematosum]|uniref:MFS multidrug transporter n=1 Tax=Penicillium mononematosum TaxID=268346 RepID=UPI002547FACB|nr:MFS multidrug transporter [Penicillium mononematosum]KAJ6180873.1 MFS multidrug transporter [Penicillium mononematosum]